MPRGATCSLISKAITIVGGSTPLSAISPRSRQTGNPHNPVSTVPGEGHLSSLRLARLPFNLVRLIVHGSCVDDRFGARKKWRISNLVRCSHVFGLERCGTH